MNLYTNMINCSLKQKSNIALLLSHVGLVVVLYSDRVINTDANVPIFLKHKDVCNIFNGNITKLFLQCNSLHLFNTSCCLEFICSYGGLLCCLCGAP